MATPGLKTKLYHRFHRETYGGICRSLVSVIAPVVALQFCCIKMIHSEFEPNAIFIYHYKAVEDHCEKEMGKCMEECKL